MITNSKNINSQSTIQTELNKNVVNHKPIKPIDYNNLENKRISKMNYYLKKNWTQFYEYYELLEHIGSGSTGEVYKGKTKNPRNNQFYSFKFCLNNHRKNKHNEVINQKNLHHSNIIQILAFYKINENDFFFISELGEYGDLNNFMRKYVKKQILSETFVNYFTKPILEALYHMHKFKLVHMDIKKGNVVLDSEINPKLIDFSSAISFAKNKPDDKIKLPLIGTGRYMAPEILNQKEIEVKYCEKIDIYSLGVTLYNLAFASYPFNLNEVKGDDYKEIKEKVNNENLTFPADFEVSEKFKNFLRNVLEKDYKKRYNIKEALNDPWVKGWDIINEEKENIGILENFIIELISDNIRKFNQYIK